MPRAPFFLVCLYIFICGAGNLIKIRVVTVSIDQLNFLRGRITDSGFNKGLYKKGQEKPKGALPALLQLLYENVYSLRKG